MALRFIMNAPKLAPLFHQCRVMNQVKFCIVTSAYKSLNGLTPDHMEDMFERVADLLVRSTRLSTTNHLYVPNRKLSVSGRALRYRCANLYNSLDTVTQFSQTLASFKHNAFIHFK